MKEDGFYFSDTNPPKKENLLVNLPLYIKLIEDTHPQTNFAPKVKYWMQIN